MARAMTNFRHTDMFGSGSADIIDVDDDKDKDKPEKPKETSASTPEPQAEQQSAPEVQAETGTSETLSADDVPYGTTPVVLAWVDGDKARAQLAYDKEQTLIPPRKGLSNELLEIIQR